MPIVLCTMPNKNVSYKRSRYFGINRVQIALGCATLSWGRRAWLAGEEPRNPTGQRGERGLAYKQMGSSDNNTTLNFHACTHVWVGNAKLWTRAFFDAKIGTCTLFFLHVLLGQYDQRIVIHKALKCRQWALYLVRLQQLIRLRRHIMTKMGNRHWH